MRKTLVPPHVKLPENVNLMNVNELPMMSQLSLASSILQARNHYENLCKSTRAMMSKREFDKNHDGYPVDNSSNITSVSMSYKRHKTHLSYLNILKEKISHGNDILIPVVYCKEPKKNPLLLREDENNNVIYPILIQS